MYLFSNSLKPLSFLICICLLKFRILKKVTQMYNCTFSISGILGQSSLFSKSISPSFIIPSHFPCCCKPFHSFFISMIFATTQQQTRMATWLYFLHTSFRLTACSSPHATLKQIAEHGNLFNTKHHPSQLLNPFAPAGRTGICLRYRPPVDR